MTAVSDNSQEDIIPETGSETNEDSRQEIKVSSRIPVWHCPNANIGNSQCIYCVCNDCYIGLVNQDESRNKAAPMYDGCPRNHNLAYLKECGMKSYFTTKYKENKTYPMESCYYCKGFIL